MIEVVFTYYPTASVSSLAAHHSFSAKERDVETGLSYFGARYYSSDLSIWLSVDPMASKYPSLSPYVYCANNPVKLVDPNGEDYEVVWDDNTITIKATYYTQNSNQAELNEQLEYWNSLSKFIFVEGKGKDAKQYTIKFDLQLAKNEDGSFMSFETDDAARQAANLGQGKPNNFMEKNFFSADSYGVTYYGNHIQWDSNKSKARSLIHEIGHTLGMHHHGISDNNIMYSGGNNVTVSTTNIRQCLKGYFSNYTVWGGSSTHIGKCQNKISAKYNGRVISNP